MRTWRIIPTGAFDIPALESWLERMAARGLFFRETLGLFALFSPGAPEQVRIHLEPAAGPGDREDGELRALYEQAGWRFLGLWGYHFHVFASADPEAQAHTDREALDYSLRRFLKGRLLGGAGLAVCNFLLLRLYWNSIHSLTAADFRYFPFISMSSPGFFPFLLAAVGFFLLDLAYLTGLVRLIRYRATAARPRRGGRCPPIGFLRAAGAVVLLPVLFNTAFLFLGLDYKPYPLEGSGFVTLTEIEGDGLPLSGDSLYNMDYISHSDTPLSRESWYFQQYASFPQHGEGIPDDLPRLEITVQRYLLPGFAAGVTKEYTHNFYYGLGDGYQSLSPAGEFDEIWHSRGELGMVLLLRRDNTVMRAEYVGEQNLLDHLDGFGRMFESL